MAGVFTPDGQWRICHCDDPLGTGCSRPVTKAAFQKGATSCHQCRLSDPAWRFRMMRFERPDSFFRKKASQQQCWVCCQPWHACGGCMVYLIDGYVYIFFLSFEN